MCCLPPAAPTRCAPAALGCRCHTALCRARYGGRRSGAETRFAARLHDVTAGDPQRLVVFFCLNDCWMSWNAARRAAALGLRAAWFPEGTDGWEAAGLPLEPALAEE